MRECNSYDNIFKKGNLDSPEWIYSFISPGSTVLDIGCDTGNLGERLKKDKDCQVSGIDYNVEALKKASAKIDETCYINLEADYYKGFSDLRDALGGRTFDYIVMGDIYEHLKNGPALLKEIRAYLKKGGKIILSVPNVQHFLSRKNIVFGSFECQNEGIWDSSHCRFFSVASFQKEMKELGFHIEKKRYVGKLFFNHRSLLYFFARILLPTRKVYCRFQYFLAVLFPSLFAYQVVVVLRK